MTAPEQPTVRVIHPTPRVLAAMDTVNFILGSQLPPDDITPDEVLYIAFWMLRCAGRCLQRDHDCETFVAFAHQAYHQAEEDDLTPEELYLKRFDTNGDTPRH